MGKKRGKDFDSKSALLEAAWQLLLEQGAGGMSVEAIIGRAGLSKGTFFHFFPAKQDLLDAVCSRIAEESWRHIGGVFDRTDLDPIARFDLFLRESRSWRQERSKAIGGLWWELSRDENATLMNKVRALSFERLAPAITALFVEANAAAQMQVDDTEVFARLTVEWMYATVEGSLRLFIDRKDSAAVDLAVRRANATMEAMERILGTRKGVLTRVDRALVAKLAADVSSNENATSRKDRRNQ